MLSDILEFDHKISSDDSLGLVGKSDGLVDFSDIEDSFDSDDFRNNYVEALRGRRVFKPLKYDSWIRLSSVGHLCPRRETLMASKGIERVWDIGSGIGLSLQVGEAFHSIYRNRLIGPSGSFLGQWLCLNCSTIVKKKDGIVFQIPSERGNKKGKIVEIGEKPNVCPNCGKTSTIVDKEMFDDQIEMMKKGKFDPGGIDSIVFFEPGFYDNEFKIRGHCDGFRYDKRRDIFLVQELKSCTYRWFKKMEKDGGFGPHITQLMSEMWLAGQNYGELIYLNKSGSDFKPNDFIQVHEFIYSESYMERNVFEPVRETRRCLKEGTVSDSKICMSPDSDNALECPLKDICFSENGG